jgi:putative acetyltransferase
VAFFVIRENGAPAGCGGIKLFGVEYAEIKRMVGAAAVSWPGLRQAHARSAERPRASHGIDVLRLETGIHQHAAIHFYEREGFARIPPFADYWDDSVSRCYEKRLASV